MKSSCAALVVLCACTHAQAAAVTPRFDLHATGFWAMPYPSDLRTTASGAPDVHDFPNPRHLPQIADLARGVGARAGFPQLPVAYFPLDAAIAPRHVDDVIPADAAQPLLLVDIDPRSPERGRLWPLVADTPRADPYLPPATLVLAPRPGMVLAPHRTYAFVVMRSLPLAVAPGFAALASTTAPAPSSSSPSSSDDRERRAWTLYQPLWPTLRSLGIAPDRVAVATVFTTGDPVAHLAEMSTQVLARHTATIDHLAVRTSGDQARNCELVGTLTVPQFEPGTPPFDTGGVFQLDGDGVPIRQRDESIPIALSLPQTTMPAGGYPLVVFVHGSSGLSTQVLDRSTRSPAHRNGTPHQGPAYILAAHGFAMAGAAMPLNPERLPDATSRSDVNLANLGAYPYVFAQGVIEQRMFIRALGALTIDPAAVAACHGVALPAGATRYRFDLSRLGFQGQSLGGTYANLVSAVEPQIRVVVPTAAGGFLADTALHGCADVVVTPARLATAIGAVAPLTYLHPVMHLLETAWEPADPLIYMPRLSRTPLPGHPARSVYQPVGQGDECYPTTIYDDAALAYGHVEAGAVVWSSMQAALALIGRAGVVPYPIAQNLKSDTGAAYTGAVVQYAGDGYVDAHYIFQQLDAVKYQYACFFETFQRTGVATLLAPASLDAACR